ncbi:MAG: competence/damage-inducible protein A, partial [Azorhizobium sp. 12-66-6]
FRIGNVFVMAGVPRIMQAMLEAIIPTLSTNVPMLSATVLANAKEGDIAAPLGAIAARHPDVSIGSYPFLSEAGPNTNIVVRSRDADRLAVVRDEVADMLSTMIP